MNNKTGLPAECYCVTAIIEIFAEFKEQFEKSVKLLINEVRQNESGALIYEAAWSLNQPGHLVFNEVFKDKYAFKIHQDSDHFKNWVKEVEPYLKSEIAVYITENRMKVSPDIH